jgi:hypothetical protein
MSGHNQLLEKSRLGRLLVNRGYITDEQLNLALIESHAAGQRIGEYLVAAGLISEKQLNQTLRRQKRTRNIATFVTMILAPRQPMIAFAATTTPTTTTTATTTTAITIVTAPKSLSVFTGQSAKFSVTASGSSLKYQWYKNGTKISGATAASYYIASAASANEGDYSVKVYNSSTSKWPAKVSLDVNSSAISITTAPRSISVATGKPASFSVAASGSGLKYQWYKNSTAISGATSNTYSIGSAASTNAGEYYAKVYNSVTSKLSTKATLTVTAAAVPLSITSNPQSVSVPVGGNTTLAVVATGSNLQYQWLKDNVKITGATNSTLALTNVQTTAQAKYHVRITDLTTTKYSSAATVTVTAVTAPVATAPKLDIGISLQPVSTTVYAGKSHTLNVSASGSGTLKYQWRKNGVPIADAVLPYLSFAYLKTSDTAQYDVVITNTTGAVTTSKAQLTVAIDRTAKLSWTPPATRVNGTALAATEIASYRVYHSTEDGTIEKTYDVAAGQNDYELANLVSGNHFFAITAIDTKGYESDLSNMANKQVVTGL